MASFTVRIERTTTHYCDITVEAEDEDDADSKANTLIDNYEKLDDAMRANKAEWELDDENYEVLEISEE